MVNDGTHTAGRTSHTISHKPSSKIWANRHRRETEILISCAQTRLTAQRAAQIRTMCQAEVDVEYLIRIAKQHMIVPLLYRSLSTSCPEGIPSKDLQTLREYSDAVRNHNRVLTEELLHLLSVFDEHRISAIPFKGPTLAATAYGDVSLREFVDVDFLIHERDLSTVESVLLSQGYRLYAGDIGVSQPTWERTYVHIENKSSVDLHWDVMPWFFPFPCDFEELWKRRKAMSLAGQTVYGLSDEDLLLILCVHGCKHYWSRLGWICDIAELTCTNQEMNWGWLVDQARILRSRRMFFLGLRLARDLLDATLPKEVLPYIDDDLALVALTTQVRKRIFRDLESPLGFFERPHTVEDLDIDTVCFTLRARERLWDKVQYCRWLLQLVMTPVAEDRAFLSLPESLSFLYYFLRPLRLIWKLSRRLIGKNMSRISV